MSPRRHCSMTHSPTQPLHAHAPDFWAVDVISQRALLVLPYVWRLATCEPASETARRRRPPDERARRIVWAPEVTGVAVSRRPFVLHRGKPTTR